MTDVDTSPSADDVPESEPDGDAANEDSTVGVGSVIAIGCSLIVLILLVGGICVFIARQVS